MVGYFLPFNFRSIFSLHSPQSRRPVLAKVIYHSLPAWLSAPRRCVGDRPRRVPGLLVLQSLPLRTVSTKTLFDKLLVLRPIRSELLY